MTLTTKDYAKKDRSRILNKKKTESDKEPFSFDFAAIRTQVGLYLFQHPLLLFLSAIIGAFLVSTILYVIFELTSRPWPVKTLHSVSHIYPKTIQSEFDRYVDILNAESSSIYIATRRLDVDMVNADCVSNKPSMRCQELTKASSRYNLAVRDINMLLLTGAGKNVYPDDKLKAVLKCRTVDSQYLNNRFPFLQLELIHSDFIQTPARCN